MNIIITSKEQILEASRQLAVEEGLDKINMRAVATKTGISVGSVYNYFPAKSDLISATVQSVWSEIMRPLHKVQGDLGFIALIRFFYETVQKGTIEYPSFFTHHSLSFSDHEKSTGRETMNQFFIHLKSKLLQSLKSDTQIPEGSFSPQFSEEMFIDFVFSNILTMLVNKEKNCDYLIAIISRVLNTKNI